jgi:uncharacterized protein with NAD-binding domain and iron-sulfur cluster
MKLCFFHVHALSGSEEQILHVFPHMWKLVLKSMPIYYNIHTETWRKNTYCDGNSNCAQGEYGREGGRGEKD